MRSSLGTLIVLSLAILLFATVSHSREMKQGQVRFQQGISEEETISDMSGLNPELLAQYTSTAVDTYCIVWFDFETMDWQGWTRFDDTAQPDIFFHVDDFDGLGGDYAPLEGTRSIWCGARPDTLDPYLCGWQSAPGYGNNWHQILVSDAHANAMRVSYSGRFDTEEGYDYVYVDYQDGSEWKNLATYDGTVDLDAEHVIASARLQTKVRFRFISDRVWSDQDGLHDTDGAAIIDDITIFGSEGPISHEDFEFWPVGATSYGFSRWHTEVPEPFGMYSGLQANLDGSIWDPCNYNFGTQIVFFIGSPNPSPTYPGLYTTPFCLTYGDSPEDWICQNERVISPIIDLTKYSTSGDDNQDADIPPEDLSDLGGTIFRYAVYQDLPLQNLVIPWWQVRNISESGCPGQWDDYNVIVYYMSYGYVQKGYEIGHLIDSDRIQVSLSCIDMCSAWYGSYGDCENHTTSPWFDNVRLYRYTSRGPQWRYRWLDLFQDNFPQDEYDLDSWVRADAANDLNGNDDPVIRPGDSIVVACTSPLAGGLRIGGPLGEAEVYISVRATDIGCLGKPALFGSDLVGTYGTYVSDDGEWTVIQCPTALVSEYPVDDKFMVDLNDALFTRGYMIEYYFEAYALDNESSTLPKHAAEGQYFEFTCLPTGKSDVLFVDDFHGRGTFEGNVETYWNPTFSAVIPPENQPDRYDVNGPSSLVSNGPGSRAYLNQLKYNEGAQSGYRIIVWDSGNLDVGTITDGSTLSDKSDDCTMLINWLDQSENDVGLFVCGDDVAEDLNRLPSTQALELMSTWCGVNFIETSYFDLTGGRMAGGIVNPLVTTTTGSIFGGDKEFYVFGGCPVINQFDVLDATANGVVSALYPDCEGDSYAAGIQSVTVNAAGYDAKTMWFGFSFMYFRDTEVSAPIIRNVVFCDFWNWFGIANTNITEDEVPKANKLSQNFPNPLNPMTTIKFDVRAKGHVSLKIYNVAGQLVKTLVDNVIDSGSYTREWTGVNNAGVKVASGVYFYRLEAGEYENVKKMVLLR